MAVYFGSCRNAARSLFWRNSLLPVASVQWYQPVATGTQTKQVEDFFDKNTRLKRPLSPHMTIYKFQLTSVLSITHRTTGLILSGAVYGLSVGMLVLPANFPHYINYLQSLHIMSPVLYSIKFALAWMFFYHATNGIRHLAWDLGYGFELKELYTTGYAVVGTSVALAALTAAL